MRMRDLLEQKLWFFDLTFIIYLVYLTAFNKPQWCSSRKSFMTDDCSEDIYGNGYYLLNPLPFVDSGAFLISTLIMCYFNAKYYGIHRNLRKSVDILSSTRKTKLVLISVLNLLHFLFYFLTKDNIIKIDVCSIIRVIFLLVVM